MIRPLLLALGLLTLAAAWLGPLPELATHRFSAHMTMHMAVVAVAAPLIALGLAGGRFDPAMRVPLLFAAVPLSVLELIVVWGWHAPALHHFARASTAGLVAEQGTFLAAGLLVWMSAVGGDQRSAGRDGAGRHAGDRAGAGVVALLLTSMHMTLLGALIALSPRPLYTHDSGGRLQPALVEALLAEQHLGGVIMLVVGGAVYMAGGLWLASTLLSRRAAPPRATNVGAGATNVGAGFSRPGIGERRA